MVSQEEPMEITDLRYFWHAATTGSFLRAAEAVHVSPPAISKAIRRLEDSLETPLFIRSTRRVTLTPAGETLRGHAERIMRQVDDAKAEVQQGPSVIAGELRIGAMEVFSIQLLPAALGELVKKHPLVRPLAHETIPERMEE